MKFIKRKNKNTKIEKSKEIIKTAKQKIKEEKRKIKLEKEKNFSNTKLGKILQKIFLTKDMNKYEPPTIKEQIFSMLYFELIGFILCLLILFALSGGKNYIKLYKELSKLINVYDTVTKNYYGELDKEEIIDKATESMLSEIGDNYTTYTNEKDTNAFLENVDGSYEGIGCTVAMDTNENIFVVEVFDNSPAKKAGIQPEDIILKIDNQDYQGKTSEDMANYVKNNKNDEIRITIKRKEEEKELTLIREKVEVPSVTSKIIEHENKKIGYIDISIFSSVTTKQFKEQLKKLESDNIEALVIDVRNDTGGYLNTVTDITNLFLKKGSIIYQLESSDKKEKIKDTTKETRTYPIAVLVNSSSASASEILASAIKESYKGYIVGTNTYGKGTVQKTKKLSDGSMIKYTVQKWLTPKGNWIHEKGVEPTHYIELDLESDKDNQLEKALEVIIKDLK